MSLPPSLPPGAPSLAEVLVQRTFAKPVHALIDGEMLDALVHTKAGPSAVAQPPDPTAPTIDVRV